MNQIRQIIDGEVVEPDAPSEIGVRDPGMVMSPLDADITAVAQVMGLETDGEKRKYGKEIKTLIEWSRTQSDKKDPIQLKWTLRNLQMKLGTPPLSEKMITRAARYAFLDMESKKNEAEKLSLME
jgi:hypothetical protein